MKNPEPSKTYHKVKTWLFYFSLATDLILLFCFFITGLSIKLRNFSLQCSSFPIIANGIYLMVFSVLFYIVHFPLNLFQGYFWEHKFGLSTQNIQNWFKDEMKGAVLSFLLMMIMAETIYFFLGIFPSTWWIYAGFFWLLMTLVVARIVPTFIIPLFYKYSDIDNQELKLRIMKLFERAKVSLKNIYAINLSSKTKKANAFICGLGKSRRVVLSDTLLSNFMDSEIETVVAHELGHYKGKDILRLTLVNTLTIFIAFYFMHLILQYALQRLGLRRIDDIAFFPILALVMSVFMVLMMPVLNGFSRYLEIKADRFSLKFSQNPHDFISMIKKLGEMNLAEFEPGRFNEFMFYDHPSIAKRIHYAQKFLS